mgnify:CR=1 FL=1
MPDGKDREPSSEAVERPWASNDKVQFDNVMSHEKIMMGYGELAIKQSIEFQQKSNDDYLVAQRQLRDEFLKHSADRDSRSNENNRYTLDRLFSVFPEEASGIGLLVQLLTDALENLKKT